VRVCFYKIYKVFEASGWAFKRQGRWLVAPWAS